MRDSFAKRGGVEYVESAGAYVQTYPEPEDPRDIALDRLRAVLAESTDTGLDALEVVAQVALILDLLDYPPVSH